MSGKGSIRKKKWAENKRADGWTWSEIRNGPSNHSNSSSSSSSSSPSRRTLSNKSAQTAFESLCRSLKKKFIVLDKADKITILESSANDFDAYEYLALDPDLLDPHFNKDFENISECYWRGTEPYYTPTGWNRIGLKVENFEEKYESWNVAYHGTSFDARFGIAALGLLLPGKITTDGRIILVRTGQIGSTKDSPSIYCSPSIHYASAFAELKPTIEDKYIQIAFQVRVEPTSYRTIQNTLGNQKWPENLPFDPKWPQDSIAWLVSDATKIKVYGLLYRDTTVEHPSFSITRQLGISIWSRYKWKQIVVSLLC